MKRSQFQLRSEIPLLCRGGASVSEEVSFQIQANRLSRICPILCRTFCNLACVCAPPLRASTINGRMFFFSASRNAANFFAIDRRLSPYVHSDNT
jgi:hypothetical protein